jgi:hypothetical protein
MIAACVDGELTTLHQSVPTPSPFLCVCLVAVQIVIGGRDKYSINGHAAQQK